jgi:hypothetical protein
MEERKETAGEGGSEENDEADMQAEGADAAD